MFYSKKLDTTYLGPQIPSRLGFRALLGALAEEIGKNAVARTRLRASLNPLSRFDFGLLATLSRARDWQPKGKS
jgi:hypothetical protein